MSASGVPPRWLRCPRKGEIVANKFIPFKTPLDDKYNNEVPNECTWDPKMFFSYCHNLQVLHVKVGLWIDLTNTNRFYDKEVIEQNDIKYVKLQCKGHGAVPSEEQVSVFINICNNFNAQHPNDLIAVHCTHGFNRTGYLICAYLIENQDWSVQAAFNTFALCRSPGIYKEDYIQELFAKYGDIEDAPAPPTLPDWCNESDDVDDDDGAPNGRRLSTSSLNLNDPRRRKEFQKLNPTFMEGVDGVHPVTLYTKITQIQQKCQQMCGWKSTGFPGSQPVSLDCNNIKFLSCKPYKVSWKADGTRYMMLIDGENEVYLIDRDNAVFKADGLLFPRRKAPDQHIDNTLLDGEMIIDVVNGEKHPRYLVYDIIKFENIDVGGTDFERRLFCLRKEIIGPREVAKREGRIDSNKGPFSIRLKEFWDLIAAKSLFGEKFNKELGHEVDGLIFQPVQDPYKAGRCSEVFKWKPHTHNSVDFKLMIIREDRPGMLKSDIGCLFVGSFNAPFAQIKLTKELRQYDKKIIECNWDYEKKQWAFMRERTDKSFPNSYTTAVAVWESIKNPVTKEGLLEFIEHRRWAPQNQKRPHPPFAPMPGQKLDSDRSLMPPPDKIPRR
ncbi:hypothetical protein B4U80_08533 [Leptotrombidium deliense]|uniref:mRNA-capping enzyme n=1 Tax=Leptotrombidium deliense TaxID=299467 RepID=A0A443SVU1_9ACAR|nr:hypothetical protein B4U80_08533 [Leptotrombidium deliense]